MDDILLAEWLNYCTSPAGVTGRANREERPFTGVVIFTDSVSARIMNGADLLASSHRPSRTDAWLPGPWGALQ